MVSIRVIPEAGQEVLYLVEVLADVHVSIRVIPEAGQEDLGSRVKALGGIGFQSELSRKQVKKRATRTISPAACRRFNPSYPGSRSRSIIAENPKNGYAGFQSELSRKQVKKRRFGG